MIALDSNIFIYVLEGNQTFGRRAADILKAAQGNACVSLFMYMEVLSHSAFLNPENKKLALSFLEEQQLQIIEMGKDIILRAAHLRASLTPKLGTGDALHLASALEAGADRFITNDQDLVKLKLKGLEIVSL